MDQTIEQRLIRTLHLVERNIPRFRIALGLANDGNVAFVRRPPARLPIVMKIRLPGKPLPAAGFAPATTGARKIAGDYSASVEAG
jgi:hypothetical protein